LVVAQGGRGGVGGGDGSVGIGHENLQYSGVRIGLRMANKTLIHPIEWVVWRMNFFMDIKLKNE
jgi:hypothetical protein